jgi:septal ring factor EnvC (AmiA/AmiB activator)
MADESDKHSLRPISLALAALAAVGWLAAGFIWWQGGQTQSYLTGQLTAAEQARESLASDLQNLEKTAGVAADLKKQAANAEKALSDASAARASAQNELVDLTKQISDARLVISGAQEEASARTRDLQAVDSRLKE